MQWFTVLVGLGVWALIIAFAVGCGKAAAKPRPLPPELAEQQQRFLREP
jgi:hypothetical protein